MITAFLFVDCSVVVWHKTGFWFLLLPMGMRCRFYLFQCCFHSFEWGVGTEVFWIQE